jgi:superfamily II DNA or RNA helicase
VSFAVGSLVTARGRDWVVLPSDDEELLLLRPLGGDDEDIVGVLPDLEEVAPARFPQPSRDDLGDARSARLLLDALRLGFRSSGGPFRSLARIAVTPRPYQLVPLLMALRTRTVRLLIADDVGIGKTIESGLIAAELLAQGDTRGLAVLCSPQLAPQWQAELRDKFNLDAEVLLPSTAIQLGRGLRRGEQLFDRYHNVIVSTDFIKGTRHRDEFVRGCPALVIVDEAHTCVEAAGTNRSSHQRYELIQRLAADPDRHVILVTATPHSGKREAFRNLLTLLDPKLAGLPDDLSGEAHRPHRELLARYLVQRRRADITTYLHERTPFPERRASEVLYQPSPAYQRLFERVRAYAREAITEPGAHGRPTTRQRVRWWSMIALLRALASSPEAAAATLRNRAASAGATSPEQADDLSRRAVLDLADDEGSDALDTPPGADEGSEVEPDDRDEFDAGGEEELGSRAEAPRQRERLQRLAREAEALRSGDVKLARAIEIVRELLDEGFTPIVFCRYIPTADYVADQLRRALRGARVEAVTGTLPPADRKRRITDLVADATLDPSARPALKGRNSRGSTSVGAGGDGKTGTATSHIVLVATDCLAEGINLQEHFSAVVHYDLAWNPTRHEQREGRVDRFGQRRPVVRTVTLYGDNPVDRVVLEVLLRKHEAIRRDLGVSVPVPTDANEVIEAIIEGVLRQERDETSRGEQLAFFGEERAKREELFEAWDRAKERERRSRGTIYAQHAISMREVEAELHDMRAALGGEEIAERFTRDALASLGATVTGFPEGFVAQISAIPSALRDALPRPRTRASRDQVKFHREPPPPPGAALLARTDPTVETLAQYVLDWVQILCRDLLIRLLGRVGAGSGLGGRVGVVGGRGRTSRC